MPFSTIPLPSLLLPLLLAASAGQDKPPRFTPPATGTTAEPTAASALQPGVLPTDATKEAKALWTRACDAALAPGAERKRVSAFQLTFEILTRRGVQRNDVKAARFLYLDAEGYVRTSLKSGREHVLGPDGPWLIDGKEEIRLTKKRENEEDLRQIDETVSIARNFLALTDPSSLRIAALSELGQAPPAIGGPLQERARGLSWLNVVSPDFQLMRPSQHTKPDTLFHVRLGLDPETGRVEQAVIGDDRAPTTVLVELNDVSPLDGFMVPGRILVFELDAKKSERSFGKLAVLELYRIPPGTLQPKLGPDDFKP
jgi:hypothetical protein